MVPKASIRMTSGPHLGHALGRGDIAALVAHVAPVDHEAMHHAIAVEPVAVALAAQVVARRADAKQRAGDGVGKATAHRGAGKRQVARRRGEAGLPGRAGGLEVGLPVVLAGGRASEGRKKGKRTGRSQQAHEFASLHGGLSAGG
jgi:hypothetical protein